MSYNNEQEAEEMVKEMMAGLATKPPGDSVFQKMRDAEGGPPMLRMFTLQAAFWVFGKFNIGKGKRTKVILILIVVLSFMCWDFDKFFSNRNPNVYEQIGLKRSATILEIEEALNQYQLC